ncbi:MAG TPA: CHRD domain-containing protein [Balneolaceae bacterium]|nr:CHRD domain-containing protein [Balneolaceae bacterium]
MMKRNFFTFLLILAIAACLPAPSLAQQTERIILAGYKLEPAVPTAASGLAVVELKNDSLQISGDFSELSAPFYGAYIMFGEKGEAGNQLFTLNVNLSENRRSGVLKADENTFVLSLLEKKLLQAGKFYILISSFDHQHGEIGGRISW